MLVSILSMVIHDLDDARGYPHDFGNLYSIKRLINPISYPIISHHIYSHCLPICKKNSYHLVMTNMAMENPHFLVR